MCALLLALMAGLPADVPSDKRVVLIPDGLPKMQGSWRIESWYYEGARALTDVEAPHSVTLEGRDVFFQTCGGFWNHRTYQARTEPCRQFIDLTSDVNDPRFGIYSLEGDVLRLCFGAVRPTSFSSEPRSGHHLIYLTREKTKKP